jgi:hypothetical protein
MGNLAVLTKEFRFLNLSLKYLTYNLSCSILTTISQAVRSRDSVVGIATFYGLDDIGVGV